MLSRIRGLRFTPPKLYQKRSSSFIDKEFQVKYTSLVVCAATFGMILGLLPIYYFLNQNYQIFVELAYDQAPELIHFLEKEKLWMNTFLFGIFTALIAFFSTIGFKMTARIAGPLHILKNHLKQLSRGHWQIKHIKVRDNDEFQDLIETYNYFFSSFQVNAKKELELLKRINISREDKDSYQAWKEILTTKQSQLNEINNIYPLISNDVNSSESHDSRHVS